MNQRTATMNRAMRRILATGILSGGIAAALLFRHGGPPAEDPPRQGTSVRLVLREQLGPSAPVPDESPAPRSGTVDPIKPARLAAPPRTAPTILRPADPRQPFPALAPAYPRLPRMETPRWGTSVGIAPPRRNVSREKPQTHRLVDGDTLEALAQRYLGSTGRAVEIYEANRGVLSRPDILPIGVELQIPPSGSGAGDSAGTIRRRPLAPIPFAP